MGETVKQIIADNPRLQPGDVFVTNDPYRGGSHLPDVTVVTPVHAPATRRVSVLHRQPRPSCRDRRHHARLDAAVLAEPGRRRGADPQLQAGRRRPAAMERIARAADERAVSQPLAGDQPGRHRGAGRRQPARGAAICDGWSSGTRCRSSQAYMRHIQAAAERKLRAALARLPAGRREFVDHLGRRHADSRRHHHRRRRSDDRLHRHRAGARPAI